MSRLSKSEVTFGLRRYAGYTAGDREQRAQLLLKAEELGIAHDLEERAFLCHALKIDFELEIDLIDLVQLAIDSGVNFDLG